MTRTALVATLVACWAAVLTAPARAQPGAASAANSPDAQRIDSVSFVSRNVFDPDEAEASFLFRLLNTLHIRTRRFVVRQELLFKRGDVYDSATVAEVERNLRALGFFRDVVIDTTHTQTGVHVRVETADAWTTTLQADARLTGGDFMWGLGIKEKNILGTGTLFRTKYRKEVDRNSFTLEASQNRLAGTRAGVFGRLDNLSDGSKGVWSFAVPYRALSDPNAVQLPGAFENRQILQFRNGELAARFFWRQLLQNVQLSIAPRRSERGYLRLGLLGQVKREEFLSLADTGLGIPDTVTGALGVSAEFVKARFKVTNYYVGFARDVDVDLSTRLGVTAWLAPSAFGYERTGIGPGIDVQFGASLGKNFAVVEGHANGLFTSSALDSGQVRGILTAVSQVVPRSAFVLRVEAGIRKGTPPGAEFDLGFDRGLRRFNAHSFTGDREIWANLEHRVFLVDEFLHLFGLGAASFLDYGGAWYSDQPRRLAGAVGVGLRGSSTRAGAITMGRLDLAYRFGDGVDGKRWVVSFGRNVTF